MVELTTIQFLELNKNLIIDENGNTNKLCPICGNVVKVQRNKGSTSIYCESNLCFKESMRGL